MEKSRSSSREFPHFLQMIRGEIIEILEFIQKYYKYLTKELTLDPLQPSLNFYMYSVINFLRLLLEYLKNKFIATKMFGGNDFLRMPLTKNEAYTLRQTFPENFENANFTVKFKRVIYKGESFLEILAYAPITFYNKSIEFEEASKIVENSIVSDPYEEAKLELCLKLEKKLIKIINQFINSRIKVLTKIIMQYVIC